MWLYRHNPIHLNNHQTYLSAHHIYQSQAKALFAYANSVSDRAWIATYDDAARYYVAWAHSSTKAEIIDGRVITVTLETNSDDARLDVPLTVKVKLPGSWLGAKLGTEELINYQTMYTAFKGATVVAKVDADGNEHAFYYKWNNAGSEGDDIYFDVSINGATYTFVIESYLTGASTDVYKAAQALKVGDTVDLVGFLYWYEGPQAHVVSITVAE
jgi:hypothetical protein